MRVQVYCRWITVAIIVVYPVVVAAAAAATGTVNFLHAMRHCFIWIYDFSVCTCAWLLLVGDEVAGREG
jgi:hypothetical protein